MSAQLGLRGILVDPEATARLADAVRDALDSEGRRVAALVAGRAPVDTGALRGAVRHRARVHRRKGKGPRVRLAVDADRARRETKPKEKARRGAYVPYGVFSDHRTGWLKGTVNAEEPAVLERVRSVVSEYVRRENQRFPAPKGR